MHVFQSHLKACLNDDVCTFVRYGFPSSKAYGNEFNFGIERHRVWQLSGRIAVCLLMHLMCIGAIWDTHVSITFRTSSKYSGVWLRSIRCQSRCRAGSIQGIQGVLPVLCARFRASIIIGVFRIFTGITIRLSRRMLFVKIVRVWAGGAGKKGLSSFFVGVRQHGTGG